ncbi:CAAX protease [Saccharopolyspora sp. TS4A08]|uniref:CAAX protease n=1 Tax=Saccharopolyspora ipomoeae TaxID=3042027 RepID=A0ABT6PU40_9PSEU|nr:CAAX protease [Saccharopolyspora sp. TS4A08]MDI2031524.1 CAAX protease [Saccharopolyspora sp. TS4A08]
MIEDAVPDELESLLSAERLGTYYEAALQCGCSPLHLCLLGGELATSFYRDLGVVEVVLRNAMNDRLAEMYGPQWWADDQLLDERGQVAIAKAWKDGACGGDSSPGRLIAQLTMGFWVHLLEPGGFVGQKPFRQRRYYDATLWRPALRFAFPGSPQIRSDVHALAQRVYALRNRIAHCEPVISGFRVPGTKVRRSPAEIHEDLITLVRWISEPVGHWLADRSRTPGILARVTELGAAERSPRSPGPVSDIDAGELMRDLRDRERH